MALKVTIILVWKIDATTIQVWPWLTHMQVRFAFRKYAEGGKTSLVFLLLFYSYSYYTYTPWLLFAIIYACPVQVRNISSLG